MTGSQHAFQGMRFEDLAELNLATLAAQLSDADYLVTHVLCAFRTHLPEHARIPICDWVERHGVDPSDVRVPGWIMRWPDERRITFWAPKFDLEGRVIIGAHGGPEHIHTNVQLEAAPAPWPTELTDWYEQYTQKLLEEAQLFGDDR